MQDTFEYASQAVCHALGVQIVYEGNVFRGTGPAVLGAGFQSVESGDVVRVSSRKIEVTLTAADFGGPASSVEEWSGGTVEFLEGPLAGQVLDVAKAKPDIEGVSVTLVLKRPSR